MTSRPAEAPAELSEEVPIACTLTSAGQAQRTGEWQALLAAATGREALPDGLRLRFPASPSLAGALARLAAAEADCCRFFDFTLQLDGEALTLTVRAPEGAEAMLADLFGASA
jgi:hypothetical protein